MRVGIVNDSPLAAEALRRALALAPEHEVIWTARDGKEAVDLCARSPPDLVLMDMIMPVMDGVEATRRIMTRTPCTILIVTASVEANASRVFEAMGCGALDAVDTPTLVGGGTRVMAEPLLAKIAIIGKLVGERAPPSCKPDGPDAAGASRRKLVAIGASAGGPAAVAAVLDCLPADYPAAVVIVQHVDERFAAGMAEWLNGHSVLPVRLAAEGDRPREGTVLLAGTGDHLALKDANHLGYVAEPRDYPYRPSVDVFFRSVCQHWRGVAAGVLLTGMGRDGAIGLKSMRDRGWHTIAQDEATSAVYGMPKAAAALDAAVEILPLQRIGPKLLEVFGDSP
jgi:two-component system, chemotaxis family, response regulator WspF